MAGRPAIRYAVAMLTLVESISLAGDRAKQNDDVAGVAGACAWVIDGATDLHDRPLSGAASDAAWIAHFANAALHAAPIAPEEAALRARIAAVSAAAARALRARAEVPPDELWKSPIASLLIAGETAEGAAGLDLGDCRLFALDAAGAAHALGGPPAAADNERQLATAAASRAGDGRALLRDPDVLEALRAGRAAHIGSGRAAVFGIDPACAAVARAWSLSLARPAHLLLATDGFAALVDRYAVLDAAGLARAALDRGLQALGAELRAIETADAGGALHPRWKKSDDATALLLRLS